jgi:hypothetical protein
MLSIAVDTAKITRLQTKFAKYGPYALKKGLQAGADYLNSHKAEMYPYSRNGSPFVWSSDKQRRFVFANVDLPYNRTMGLASAGRFSINESSFWVEYTNSLPWWKYVLHSSYQIIGHKTRGWPVINDWVVKQSGKVVPDFKKAVLDAWTELDSLMFGGGAGL